MKHLVLSLTLVLIVAACSGSPEATTTSAGASEETVPTTLATTSTTETPATTGPSTTTTVPAAADTFLIAGNTCLLGWWDGDWQSEGLPPVTGGEQYQVVRLAEPITTSEGTEPRPWCDPLELLNIEFDPQLPGDWQDIDALAIQTLGDVRPHKVEMLSTSLDAYEEATSILLAGRVAGIPEVNLKQVIRTDLEGDGVDEVVVVASTMPDDPVETAAGNYTIVYLRKIMDGDVETALLGVHVVDDEGPFGWVQIEVAAIADLNGDGLMEIVLNGNVWEGAFLQAFEWAGSELGLLEVLSCGCGS